MSRHKHETRSVDVALVGAGIMSATLAVMLKTLQPDLSIEIIERLPEVAQESSAAWNNAGTGHAANCELNYTPPDESGNIDITKALRINSEFDMSRQFWAYLVRSGAIESADSFIHSVPHMSFVTGEESVAFLRKRFEALSAHHCFEGMRFSDDPEQIAQWAPLVMEGRDSQQQVAATRMAIGTDVDFGALTKLLVRHLRSLEKVTVPLDQEVVDIRRHLDKPGWSLAVRNGRTSDLHVVSAGTVVLGAGGHSLTLLQKSRIPEADGYAGFPVSGIWLKCGRPETAKRHNAKVYGVAEAGSPPMSVPHLDTRIIEGQRWLLFGPYAGFSTKFLKHGSLLDLPRSVRAKNLEPMLSVARNNFELEQYLVEQVFQSRNDRFDELRKYYPDMAKSDWELEVAGQRVQVIRKRGLHSGELEFGTEVVRAHDASLFAVLGASPGASTAVSIMTQMFADGLCRESIADWRTKIVEMIPSFGQDLATDANLLRRVRSETAEILNLAQA